MIILYVKYQNLICLIDSHRWPVRKLLKLTYMHGCRKLAIRCAFFFFLSIAAGVKHLRDNDIIHRDIKPGNILRTVAEDGRYVERKFILWVSEWVCRWSGVRACVLCLFVLWVNVIKFIYGFNHFFFFCKNKKLSIVVRWECIFKGF